MAGNIKSLTQFGDLGDEFIVSDDILQDARQFANSLYGKMNNDSFQSLSMLRQHFFATKMSKLSDLRSLPPTDNAYHLHVLSSLYQIVVFKRAHISNPGIKVHLGQNIGFF